MATLRLPGTVLRSFGACPCTSALGLRTRRYSALRSKLSPLSNAMVSVLRSLCSRSSVGHGCETSFIRAPPPHVCIQSSRDRTTEFKLAQAHSLSPAGRDAMGRRRGTVPSLLPRQPMERPMQRNDLSRSLVAFEQNSTLVSVVELSFKTWLVAGLVPGLKRQPLKKQGADADALLALLHRWRAEAVKAGGKIERIVVAFEAGRDGFWLARWLRARRIEAFVIHPTSMSEVLDHRRCTSPSTCMTHVILGWTRTS